MIVLHAARLVRARAVVVLERLLDLREVVHGCADGEGEVTDLAGRQADASSSPEPELTIVARSPIARCRSSVPGVRTRTR
jgi:hypothetical protein